MGFPDAELSITLLRDDEMAELAGRFGRSARATDVLAFSTLEGEGARHRGDVLGDVVISLETTDRQARQRRVGLQRELDDLLIHGVLHLVGMDHEREVDAYYMRHVERVMRWTLDQGSE